MNLLNSQNRGDLSEQLGVAIVALGCCKHDVIRGRATKIRYKWVRMR